MSNANNQFRAWDSINKEWVDEDLIITNYGLFEGYHTLSSNQIGSHLILSYSTLIPDIKGKIIFTADKVNVYNKNKELVATGQVLRSTLYGDFYISGDNVANDFRSLILKGYSFEVIGTIYEDSNK